MAALAWLLIPLLTAIGAGLWGGWASRNRKTAGDGIELNGYARFRAAMEGPPEAMARPEAVDGSDLVDRREAVAVERSGVVKRPVALERSSPDAV